VKAHSGYFSCHRTFCNTGIIRISDYHFFFFRLHKEDTKVTVRVTLVTTWAGVAKTHRLYSFLPGTLVGGRPQGIAPIVRGEHYLWQ